MPRNVCVCRQHQNMALILEALHKFDENFPAYAHELPQTLVCNSDNDFCWNNICGSCKDAQLYKDLYNLNNDDCDKNVQWYQWEKVPGPNGKEYLEKTLKKGSVSAMYDAACAMLPSFLLHYFIKQQQVNAYEDHKNQVQYDSELAVLQIDFAENFSTLWQDEVQSAHWNKKQITVFTSVTWQQDSCTSAVVISDDLTHSRDSVIIFIDKLLFSILDKNVKTLQMVRWTKQSIQKPVHCCSDSIVTREAHVKDMLELLCNITWERTSRWDWWNHKENGNTKSDSKKT